jgi:hypothetical protein
VTAMQLDALILHEPHSWIPFPTLRVAGDDTERSAWQAEPCFIQERAIR